MSVSGLNTLKNCKNTVWKEISDQGFIHPHNGPPEGFRRPLLRPQKKSFPNHKHPAQVYTPRYTASPTPKIEILYKSLSVTQADYIELLGIGRVCSMFTGKPSAGTYMETKER